MVILALVGISCHTHYKTVTTTGFVGNNNGSAEHGRYLVVNMCSPCHYNSQTKALTGKQIEGLPRIAGRIYSSSLTNEPQGTVANYTDAELAYLIRTGINREGHFVPYMMRPNLADEDMSDIIAFLRTNDPMLQPVPWLALRKTRLSIAGRLGMRLATHPQPFRAGIQRPASTDSLALGRYLVDNMGCFHCHSASPTKLSYLYPEKTKGYLAGGAKFITHEGRVRGPNITVDPTNGIYDYSREDLRRVLQQGITRKGQHVKAPAEVFPLKDEEADAIYAYLHSYPPKRHRVK